MDGDDIETAHAPVPGGPFDGLAGGKAEKGVTAGQIALAWVLAQGDDVAPIPGTKRIKYLEENVGASAVELSDADLTALEAAVPRDAVVGDRYGDMSTVNV